MSLVAKVGQAGPLKPEIRLAQAVSHFESCLPSDRKPEFRNLKIQTLQSPPGPKDVMRLTGEMDPSRKAGSRCFGPRFTNFLHGVQRFAALGDIIIGGSQNLVACGVWSVVRTSLLSVVNFSSYIEQLSQLIMEVGRTAPLHEKMALLYPKSERLQSHLSEYFIVVVSLCHHTMMFSQRSSFRKLSSAFSDPDLKKFQSELCAWSNSIKNEIQALMAERIEVEAQKSSLFRLNLDKISKRRFHKKRIELQYRLLDLCSTYDHETTWKQIRKIGNTTCFLNDEYETWKKAQDHEIHALVYHGKLGCGKSVMLANIIQDLASQANKNSTVAYFFCRNDVSESLKARTIIGSLVRQLLRHFLAQSQDTEDVSSLQGFEHAIVMDYEEMYRLVERCKSSGQQSYIVVDGLDLCDHAEWKKFLTNMQGMQDRLASHVCIALRSAPNDKLLDVRHGPYFRIITNNNLVQNAYVSQAPKIRSMPNNKEDIESYIEAELEYRLRNRQLIIGDPTLILDIQDVLSNSADGMFLWVALQLEFLCDMQTDQEIRNALTELPKDLSDTYMRILRKRQPSGSIYQRRIFELVVVAVRPLTLDEMRVALSVTPGDTNWSTSRLLNDVLATLACCGCLLAVDEEDHTVRLVHSSVETFLLDGYQDLNSETIRLSSAHGQMSGILVTYLRYDIFNTEVSQVRIPEMNVESIPSKIVSASTISTKTVGNLAMKLLQSRRKPNFDISKTIASLMGSNQVSQEYHLLSYAKSHCVQHLWSGPSEMAHFDQVDLLFSRRLVNIPPNIFHAAVTSHNSLFLVFLVELGYMEYIESTDANNQTPLSIAIALQFLDGVSALLQIHDMNSGRYAYTDQLSELFFDAIDSDNVGIVTAFFSRSDLNANLDSGLGTPLTYAIMRDKNASLEALLSSSKVDITFHDRQGHTALSSTLGVDIKLKALELIHESGRAGFSEEAERILARWEEHANDKSEDLGKAKIWFERISRQ